MKEYAPEQLRNVGLFSQGGAGKTWRNKLCRASRP
jgi:hypothetical protein